jgi:hypothetical protein
MKRISCREGRIKCPLFLNVMCFPVLSKELTSMGIPVYTGFVLHPWFSFALN